MPWQGVPSPSSADGRLSSPFCSSSSTRQGQRHGTREPRFFPNRVSNAEIEPRTSTRSNHLASSYDTPRGVPYSIHTSRAPRAPLPLHFSKYPAPNSFSYGKDEKVIPHRWQLGIGSPGPILSEPPPHHPANWRSRTGSYRESSP